MEAGTRGRKVNRKGEEWEEIKVIQKKKSRKTAINLIPAHSFLIL